MIVKMNFEEKLDQLQTIIKVKESNRIKSVVDNLKLLGANVEELEEQTQVAQDNK